MVFKRLILLSLSSVFLMFAILLLQSCASPQNADKRVPETTEVDQQGLENPEPIAEEVEEFEDSRPVDFILGVGDTIKVSVYDNEDLSEDAKIDVTGTITFALIGDVIVAGRSIPELQQELTERFSEYIVNPQVGVRVTAIESRKVIVLGEVRSPGVFPLDRPYRVADFIATAGGLTEDAKTREIAVIRRGQNEPTVLTYDLESTLEIGDVSSNIMVQNGDIIYVPVTTLASVSRVFAHLGRIIYPIVALETGFITWPQVVDALSGSSNQSGQIIVTAP